MMMNSEKMLDRGIGWMAWGVTLFMMFCAMPLLALSSEVNQAYWNGIHWGVVLMVATATLSMVIRGLWLMRRGINWRNKCKAAELNVSDEDMHFYVLRKLPHAKLGAIMSFGTAVLSSVLWLQESYMMFGRSVHTALTIFVAGPLILLPAAALLIERLQPAALRRARRIAKQRGVRLHVHMDMEEATSGGNCVHAGPAR